MSVVWHGVHTFFFFFFLTSSFLTLLFLVNQIYEFVMVTACFNVYITSVWFLVLIGLHGSHLVFGLVTNLVLFLVYLSVDSVVGTAVSDVAEVKCSSGIDFFFFIDTWLIVCE